MKRFLVVLSLVLGFSAFSASKLELRETMQAINSELRFYEQTPETLSKALFELKDALDILRKNDDGDEAECIKTIYDIYFKSYDSGTAMDKSKIACDKIADVEVTMALYEYAFRSLSNVSAIELATNYSGDGTYGKKNLTEYIVEKYFISLSAVSSVKKTGVAIKKLSRNSFNCLNTSYDAYYRQFSSSVAMDKAVLSCE